MNWLRKWIYTVRIELASQLAYKLNFLLLVIGPAAVFFSIKVNLWWSIFQARQGAPVAGYTFDHMLRYQSLVLIVTLLGQSYANRNISDEIRLGRISAFLLYPFGFISYHLGSFGAAQILNVATTLLLLLALYFYGIFPIADLSSFIAGVSLTLLVSIQWFFVWFLLSSSAFWLEESWVLRVIFILTARFLSGAVIPLELFPEVLQTALRYTPFPYLTYVPVQVFAGNYTGSLMEASCLTLFWTLSAMALALAVWRKGVRLYSAAGI